MVSIGIVIPFYQESAGLLDECITSVISQEVSSEVVFRIVVVDDGSPVPAAAALKGTFVPAPHSIAVLVQRNTGPGAARNAGLDHFEADKPDFIAFIDSDDLWRPAHISCGLEALGSDADFFFCDHERWNFPNSYLEDSKTFKCWLISEHSPLRRVVVATSPLARLYEFDSDRVFDAFLVDYLAQTSTVIYRFCALPELRFNPALRYAGEDNMFWLEAARAARAVRVSLSKDVVTGQGVNMFAATAVWAHPNAARRAAAQVLFFWMVRSEFKLSPTSRVLVKRRLRERYLEFWHIWIRKLVRSPVEALQVMYGLFGRSL